MPRRKKKPSNDDEVQKDTLFFSMHLMLDRCVKALSMHTAYQGLCDDIRSLIRLSEPHAMKHLEGKILVIPGDESIH